MDTPWGEGVTPENAWTEYPRPQLRRDAWLSLNGLWEYAIRPRTEPLPDAWDGEILVPFPVESALSRVARRVGPTQRLWYRRRLTPPTSWAGRRMVLHFGAVDYEAAVWIDGAFVAAHCGGFDPFSIDVSEFLQPDDVELVVGVWDPSNRGEQSRGKQHLNNQGIWYTAVTGIWQSVWLEPLPAENHIEELRITPDLAGAAIDVEVILGRPTRRSDLGVRLRVLADGREVAARIAAADRRVRLSIDAPRAWSPEQPFLYDLVAELVSVDDPLPADDGQRQLASLDRRVPLRGPSEAARYAAATVSGEPIDRVCGCFGMRSLGVGPDREGRPALLLNGEPRFQLGTLDQGWWPDGLLTPPAPEAIVYEIEFLKASGFNMLRKHIKVEPAIYYHHCDRLGLLVWQDMPSAFAPAQFVAPNDEGEALKKAVVVEQYELEMRRMINRLGAHPSIIMWVIHNEGWGQFDSARLASWVRGLDPTRLVNAASGWLDVEAGDVRDRHDYAESPQAPAPHLERALVLGEYGGVGWPIEGHLWNPDIRNWGYQTYDDADAVRAAYRRKTDAVIALHREAGLAAAVYTQTTDVEGEVNGLLTYDRRVEKLPREWLADVHAPLRAPSARPIND
ncbi:MAG: glycoside hydrolase family 2 TIM barrel-domain containing protein [Pseudomonadales bacterium]